ncbi:MAG: hypothetical protein NVS9B14_15960 [Candidatus Acidiferrum sp.]
MLAQLFRYKGDYVLHCACGKVGCGLVVLELQHQISAIDGKNPEKVGGMSAFEDHKEELERYEQMFGRERGRLAVSLDRLTNALVLVGQHGVYCTSQRNPTLPAMDLRMIVQELTHAKELLQSVMEEMRRAKQAP